MLTQWGENLTLLGRRPTLAQVAHKAVFMASDRAAAITGTVIDLTRGTAVRNEAWHWSVCSTSTYVPPGRRSRTIRGVGYRLPHPG